MTIVRFSDPKIEEMVGKSYITLRWSRYLISAANIHCDTWSGTPIVLQSDEIKIFESEIRNGNEQFVAESGRCLQIIINQHLQIWEIMVVQDQIRL